MVGSMGPAESVLAATVARRYYLNGEAKKDIADELGINRFKVARLLESALESGLVTISIATVGGVDMDASSQLAQRFGLTRCVVVASSNTPSSETLAQLGRTAAELMSEVLTDQDVLGLPWSRSVLAMTTELRDVPAVQVVQLSGAMELPGINASTVDIVRETARVSRGSSVIFHAPFLLDDAASASAVRRQPSVGAGLRAVRDVTHAVVGLGLWSPGLSTVHDMATVTERKALAEDGVVGEIAGVFFDEQGQVVASELSERLITLSGPDLTRIPHKTAIVEGAAKAPGVVAALRGGLINGLVVDSAAAIAMLQHDATRAETAGARPTGS
ncbi:MAG: sugar-binding domain-containing protein [Ornithinimicrobium sp.]